MMELPQRQFIHGELRDAFMHGVEIVLTKKRMKKIALIRLSLKTDGYGRETLQSIWGRPERAPMTVYALPIADKSKEGWLQAGKSVGLQMENWVDNDPEFDRAEAKALGLQFNVWATSENWDRVQDLINVLEHDYSQHLNGRLHWRVRKALCDLIEMMMVDANTAIATHLAEPDGRDALLAIVKLAGLELATKKVKEVA